MINEQRQNQELLQSMVMTNLLINNHPINHHVSDYYLLRRFPVVAAPWIFQFHRILQY